LTVSPTTRAGRSATRAKAPADTPSAVRRQKQRVVPPILVRQMRDGFEASAHRGDIVEVDTGGRVVRALGDPNRPVLLGTCGNPFATAALVEAGGVEAFQLEPAEIAVLASTHSGEDLHVRTLQSVFRRSTLSQGILACGAEGMPLDALTAARLARDGERPGAVRHMCSGEHAVLILLSKLKGWDLETYWQPGHPALAAVTTAISRALGSEPGKLEVAIDVCGLPTVVAPLHEIARAYAFLADPGAIGERDPRAALAPSLRVVRDAMLENPEMVAGTRDRLDTSLMKAAPGGLISKTGGEGLRAVAILGPPRANGGDGGSSGLAVKIEDGGGHPRASWAASVEALHQVGLLDAQAMRALGRFHHPTSRDPHGRVLSSAIPKFDLVPLGELIQ
jgi:L-asparaginase II